MIYIRDGKCVNIPVKGTPEKMIMKCEICGVGGPSKTVFRVNELGVTGIWRCREHLTKEQVEAINPEVNEIVNVIEGREQS